MRARDYRWWYRLYRRMRGIPPPLYREISNSPNWGYCWRKHSLHDHACRGRITTEHAIIYRGQQVNEAWAIIRICAYSHNVDEYQDSGIMNKEINEWIALSRLVRLPPEELAIQMRKYPLNKWFDRLEYLTSKYGDLVLSTTKKA